MRNGKLFVLALFTSILGACATTSAVKPKTSLPHPRPDLFWENGQAVAQVFHVYDKTERDQATGKIKIVTEINPDTGKIEPVRMIHRGSAVVVDVDGLILTNSHVVDATTFEPEGTPARETDALLVCKDVRGKAKPDCDRATIVAVDKDRDVAWLRTDMKFDRAVTFGPDSELLRGDEIYFWGNVSGIPTSPLRGHYINRVEADDLEKGGIMAATDNGERLIKGPFLLMDLRIGPGSSGGPMFDSLGRCIGITSMAPKDGPRIGYIIPSSTITGYLKEILP